MAAHFIRLVVFTLMLAGLLATAPRAQAYTSSAAAAILMDHTTGQILFEKDADRPLPTASLSKLMTVFMLFERIEQGTLALDDTLPVSEKAWRKGGSKMFVEVGARIRVEDLIRGIIVQSGNDACIVVAEGLAGSEDAFAELMNTRAREIGLTNTTLRNASGWPHPEHKMSVRDLATLASLIINRFPARYTVFGEREFTYNGIRQYARNPLLHRGVPGVDGMKTGYTRDAGYGLVASSERDGRRLVLVIAGLETPGERAREGERLLEYGFRNFDTYRLFAAGETVEEADVWLGEAARVPLVPTKDVAITLSHEARRSLEVKLVYESPVPAPIAEGAELAHLEVSAAGMETRRISLVSGVAVQATNMFGRVQSALGYLIWGPS